MENDNYDVVVCGTGISECILSSLLAYMFGSATS